MGFVLCFLYLSPTFPLFFGGQVGGYSTATIAANLTTDIPVDAFLGSSNTFVSRVSLAAYPGETSGQWFCYFMSLTVVHLCKSCCVRPALRAPHSWHLGSVVSQREEGGAVPLGASGEEPLCLASFWQFLASLAVAHPSSVCLCLHMASPVCVLSSVS